jgi:hypothetical protein
VDDGPRGAAQRLEGALDELLPGLGQDLDGHVRGNAILFDELAHKGKVVARGRGKTHLDLLEAELDQQVPHARLLGRGHGLDQRLVAIAQIHAAPARRAADLRSGQRGRGHGHGYEGLIAAMIKAVHGALHGLPVCKSVGIQVPALCATASCLAGAPIRRLAGKGLALPLAMEPCGFAGAGATG